MARNASSKKAEPEYTLGYDADGNVVLVPVTRDTSPARSPFSRISEGAMEGYGYQPLGMSEKDIAEYPNAARYLNPIAKALDAVRRAPGAVAGGLSGAAGTGAELWTGDRGVANEAQRAVASALEYGGNQGMATMGGPRPSAKIPKNGELFPPEPATTRQLGFTEKPIVDIRRELLPGVIRAGSAEGLPRLTYEDPFTRYRLASEQGQRIGPRRPSEAFRPVMDEVYTVPEQLNRTPETTTPSSAARFGDESPMQAERSGAARTAHEEFLAELRAADEARATNEGMPEPGTRPPAAPAEAPPARPMTAPALPEGNVPAWQARPAPGIRRAAPAEAPSPAQPTFDFGGPQSVGGQMVDPLTGRAWMPRRFDQAAPQSATGSFSPVTRAEAVIPQRPVDLNALLNEPRESIPLERPRISTGDDLINQAIADVTGQAPADPLKKPAPPAPPAAQSPSSPIRDPWGVAKSDTSARVPNAGSKGVAWTDPSVDSRLLKGMENAAQIGIPSVVAYEIARQKMGQPSMYFPDPSNNVDRMIPGYTPQSVEDFQRMFATGQQPQRGQNATAQPAPASFPIDEVESQYVRQKKSGPDWLDDYINRPRPTQTQGQPMGGNAPATRSPPAQMSAAPAGGGSILDKIFSGKDYQSSGGQLQQQQDGRRVLNWGDSDNASDFFRAAAMQRKLQDQGQDFTGASGSDIDYSNRMAGDGKARGGAAEQKPSKEAMLHKSLEIIHHMIKNR